MLSRRRPSLGVAASAVLLVYGTARPAAAQPRATDRVYVSGSLLGEVKRFSGDVETNVFNGEAVGGSLAVGTSLSPRFELELGLDIPRGSETRQPRMVTFQRSTFTFESTTTSRTVKVATLVRLHTERHGRLRLGYLGGLSVVRFRRRFDAEASADVPSALIPRPQELIDYSAAPTLGIEADVAVARRVSIVPAVRATAFEFRDGSALLLTTRVAVRVSF